MKRSNKAAAGGSTPNHHAHNQPGMGQGPAKTGGHVPDMGSSKGSFPRHRSSNKPGVADSGFNGDREG